MNREFLSFPHNYCAFLRKWLCVRLIGINDLVVRLYAYSRVGLTAVACNCVPMFTHFMFLKIHVGWCACLVHSLTRQSDAQVIWVHRSSPDVRNTIKLNNDVIKMINYLSLLYNNSIPALSTFEIFDAAYIWTLEPNLSYKQHNNRLIPVIVHCLYYKENGHSLQSIWPMTLRFIFPDTVSIIFSLHLTQS